MVLNISNCRKCNVELILGKNWRECAKKQSIYLCNECDAKHTIEHRKNHRIEFRNTLKKTSRVRRLKLKTEIFNLLGNKCSNPFNLNHGDFLTDWRCLQIDHVNGNGNNLRQSKGQETYMKEVLLAIKAGSQDYQLLCANCNWIKRFEKHEHGAQNLKLQIL